MRITHCTDRDIGTYANRNRYLISPDMFPTISNLVRSQPSIVDVKSGPSFAVEFVFEKLFEKKNIEEKISRRRIDLIFWHKIEIQSAI